MTGAVLVVVAVVAVLPALFLAGGAVVSAVLGRLLEEGAEDGGYMVQRD